MRRILVLLLAPVFLLSGCMSIGLLSPTNQFDLTESIELKELKPDILEVTAQVGRSLGYKVISVNEQKQTVQFAKSSSVFVAAMIGKASESTITVTIPQGKKQLDIQLGVKGNLGRGKESEARTNLYDFKKALREKLRV